jgi:hypothetical protein
MEPKDSQIPKKDAEVINLADERIARRTPFGPMSAYRGDPENRIKHKSVKEQPKKDEQ